LKTAHFSNNLKADKTLQYIVEIFNNDRSHNNNCEFASCLSDVKKLIKSYEDTLGRSAASQLYDPGEI